MVGKGKQCSKWNGEGRTQFSHYSGSMDFMEPQEIAVFDGETPSLTVLLILAREEHRLWSMAGTQFS